MGKSSIRFVVAALVGFAGFNGASALGLDGPCATPETQDTKMAIFDPDRYAWVLFKELNHPASLWSKCPDIAKELGDPGPVVWETWRNIATEADRTVFPAGAADPGPWRTPSPDKFEVASLSNLPTPSIVRGLRDLIAPVKQRRSSRKRATFSHTKWQKLHHSIVAKNANEDRAGTEVRINRDTYNHIRENELYNRDVLEARAAKGIAGSVDLPPETKEIKARWMEIKEEDKPRYHWVEFENDDGSKQTWGLTALHISTKDLPNWFWATWEHIDTSEDFVNDTVDAYACPEQPVGCARAPKELDGTKWENYILRGTQVDFVDSRGNDTLLASAQIEKNVEKVSSCITCHAEAAMLKNGEHHIPSAPYLGIPKSNKISGLMQTDFTFIFERASSPSDE